jgi:hypothetical protein
LNNNLRRALAAEAIDPARIKAVLEEARGMKVSFEGIPLGYFLKRRIEKMSSQFGENSYELSLLQNLESLVDLAGSLPFEVDFWKIQNLFFDLRQTVFAEFQKKAEAGEKNAQAWVEHFKALGEKLNCQFS